VARSTWQVHHDYAVREETSLDVEVTDLVRIYRYPGHVIAYDGRRERQLSLSA
jgi:hypothetical protein